MKSELRRKRLEGYFSIFLGGFLGFVFSLFFLHFIHVVVVGEFSAIEAELDLLTFLNTTPERWLEAIGIIVAFILSGLAITSWVISWKKTRGLEWRIKILEDLDKTRTEFIWMASHQLLTPLSALKWSLGMILGGDFGKIKKKQSAILGEVYTTNKRLISLVMELLNVAQIEGKHLKITLKIVSLNKFQKAVKEVFKSLKVLADTKNLLLSFEPISSSFPEARIKVDISKIQQVIQSILENAINYTPSKKKIKVQIKIIEDDIVVQVVDEGIGIPKKEQSKIFSKFFRASNAFKIQSGGTGLGLYLSKLFMEEHKGKIWFISEENKGSTFSFSLPIKLEKPNQEFLKNL